MLGVVVGTLIENASHVAITFRRAVAIGYPCTLFVSRACSHPGRELLGGRKGCCRGTHLGNDLLCRIDTQAWHFRQPLDRCLMLAEQSRHLFVQLPNLLVDQLQLLQEHLEQSTVDWVELGAGAECIAQLRRCGAQILMCQRSQSRRIGFSVGKCLQHPPLAPSRSETRLDNLMWASSSRASKRFCSCTRLRVNWYFLRITVRQRRCSASGTKLRLNSFATSRFTRRSASGKSFLRPRGPRFDCACARCNVPDIGPVVSRFWPLGFQYCSSAPQTGFQYFAVDSITTSSTSCSISQAASNRSCSGLLPYRIRSNWYSP